MGATDYEALRMAQRAALASSVASSQDGFLQARSAAARKPAGFGRRAIELDANAREIAVHRASVLLQTAADHYGITAAELEEERLRIRGLSDQDLLAAEKAYAFASLRVAVMLDDNKARECAMATAPGVGSFFDLHGVSEEDLCVDKTVTARPRRR